MKAHVRSLSAETTTMIDPYHPALRAWYLVVILAATFAVAYAPYALAVAGGQFWAQGQLVVLDLVFAASALVNWRTRFLRVDGQIAGDDDAYTDRAEFTNDLICAVPVECVRAVLAAAVPAGAEFGHTRRFSVAQVVLLLNVFRALAFNDRLNALAKVTTFAPRFFDLCKLVGWLLLLIHWLSTGVAIMWSYKTAHFNFAMWIDALYWSSSTVIPVGYGNIAISRPYVMFLACVIMFISVAYFYYVVLQMADDGSRYSRVRGALSRAMEDLTEYLRLRRLPAHLSGAILSHFYASEPTFRPRSYHELELLHHLPVGLRREIGTHVRNIHRRLLVAGHMPETKIDTELVAQLCLEIEARPYLPGAVLLQPGSQCGPVFLGIVAKGIVEATNQVTGHSRLLTEGSYFGGPPLFPTTDVLFRTLTISDIYLLDYNRLIRPLRRAPNVQSHLTAQLRARIPSIAADPEFLASTALWDTRFDSYRERCDADDLAPILAVTDRMSRDDLESVLVMVESLVKRGQVRDGMTLAVNDLLMQPARVGPESTVTQGTSATSNITRS